MDALTYVRLISRARLERRTEWVVRVLGRFLPRSLQGSSFTIFCLWMLGGFVAQTVVFGAALFGVLRITDPLTALSLAFAFLLVAAASAGATTVRRTIAPQDEQRLLMAPISDRRAHLLAFAGHGSLTFLENVLVLPVTLGIAASAIMGGGVSYLTLWSTIIFVVLIGASSSYVVDRLLGSVQIRRVSKGVRSASVLWYAVVSTATFGIGWMAARVLVPWLSRFPGDVEQVDRWFSSFPDYAAGSVSFLLPLLQHAGSPSGALARAAMGETGAFFVCAVWAGAVWGVAVFLWARSGGWYRSGWRGGWQDWRRRDLFDLAEDAYLKLARLLFRRQGVLLEVQIHNLCRRREWAAANAFDLFGGAFNWLPVGLAAGAAPVLQESLTAAFVFALLVGMFQGSESARGPFVFFKGALAVDAEGRQAGRYRAAGRSVLTLYKAKLALGQLISVPPLLVTLTLIALLGGLPPGAWVLLFTTGAAAWVIGLHVELLPSLISPHFDWDHPEEIEDYYEREQLSDWSSRLLGSLYAVGLVLVSLLLSGRIAHSVFLWVASGFMAAIALCVVLLMARLGRRVARFTDRADFPA